MSGQFARLPKNDKDAIRFNQIDLLRHKNLIGEYAYLSTKRPMTYKYFTAHLFKLEQVDYNIFKISRDIADSISELKTLMFIQRYDKNNVCLDGDDGIIEFKTLISYSDSSEIDEDGYIPTTITFEAGQITEYNYVKIGIQVHYYDSAFFHYIKKYVPMPKKVCGCTTIECNGGSVRIKRKTLADASPFFKNLFQGEKMAKYTLDVDLMDFIAFVYCLPPFCTNPVTYGSTLGALYRISEKLGCVKIADMCDNYINLTKKFAPLTASFMAKFGNVPFGAEYYEKVRSNMDTRAVKEQLREEKDGRIRAANIDSGRIPMPCWDQNEDDLRVL